MRQIFLSAITGEFGERHRVFDGDLSLARIKDQESGEPVQRGCRLLQTLDDCLGDHCGAVITLYRTHVGQLLNSDEVRWLQHVNEDSQHGSRFFGTE